MRRQPSIYVVGAGAAGTSLALALRRAGVPVMGLHGRNRARVARAARLATVVGSAGPFPEAIGITDVVLIAVSDDAIARVASRLARSGKLRPKQIVLHASGVHGLGALDALRGLVAATGSLHPLQSLAEPKLAARRLHGATFAIEGDPKARKVAAAIARSLGGRPADIPTRAKALYHAAASMTSNGTVGVLAAAVDLLAEAGVARPRALRVLIPLLAGTVDNLRNLGLPRALTGPVARGDTRTIAIHRAALSACGSPHLALYDALVDAQMRLLRRGRPRRS